MEKAVWKGKKFWFFVICCMACLMERDISAPKVIAKTYQDFLYFDNEDDTASISGYIGSSTELVIPERIDGKKVIEISSNAFNECYELTSITIPKSVTNIEVDAFWNCSKLNSILIDSNNKVYDSRNNCNAIIKTASNTLIVGCNKTIIPDDVTSIGAYAFSGYSELTSITIPASVTNIDTSAFSWCSGLNNIVVDSGNKVYDSRNNCNAIIKTASNTLVTGCNKTVIPTDITSIGEDAFINRTDLTDITIPSNITSIGDYAFMYCEKLSSIYIPENVEYIGCCAFSGCSELNNITVESGNKIYDSRNDCNAIIETDSNTLLVGCANTIIPNDVTSIGESAFLYCSELKTIVIPDSIVCIDSRAFEYTGLISVNIPKNVQSIGNSAFLGCSELNNISIPNSVTAIGEGAFSDCSSLSSVIIPNDVRVIACNLFSNCINLKNITIPNGVAIIDEGAFSSCSALSNIIIPNSVTNIGQAFIGCSGLISITIPNSVTEITDGLFDGCPPSMIIYTETGSLIEKYAKEKGFMVKFLNTSTSITPSSEDTKPADNSVTTPPLDNNSKHSDENVNNNTNTVAAPATKGSVLTLENLKCKVKIVSDDVSNPTVSYLGTTSKNTTTVKVPDTVIVDNITYTVTAIADKAFSSNKKIKNVSIGKNVISIGKDAFKNCTKLKNVEIKSTSLNKVGANAFSGDKSLTKITLKSTKLTKNSIGKNALKGTNKKLVIKAPKNKVKEYQKYFKNKGNKTVKVKK